MIRKVLCSIKNFSLNQFPIRNSLRLIFNIIFIIPFLFLSFVFLGFISSTVTKWELERIEASIFQVESSVNNILHTVKTFSDRIVVNKQLQDILAKDYSSLKDIYNDYANLSFLVDYYNAYKEIESFRIYTENQTLLNNSFIYKVSPKIREEEWYKRAILVNGMYSWFFKEDTVSKKTYLCLVRAIINSSDNKPAGVLVVNIEPGGLCRLLNSQAFETALCFDDSIIYHSKINIKQEEIEELQKVFNSHQKNGLYPVTWETKPTQIFINRFSPKNKNVMDFALVFIIPTKFLSNTRNRIIYPTIFVLFLLACLSYLLIHFFVEYINRRVGSVQEGINCVVKNDFEINPTIGGNDEFEQIYHALYDMSCSIKKLINQVYVQNLEKEQISSRQNEIRYKMLATQINPHFLFNTLETIRMKSLAVGDKDVAVMLKMLAKLLRYNLSITGKKVLLSNELEAIQNYLSIQHMRFGNRVSYDIQIDFDIQKVVILPLLIQPLVENSFSHGLENKLVGGFINILITVISENDEKFLKIVVKDNGKGIENKKLYEINKLLEVDVSEETSASIGLFNVNSRIKLTYGKQYGLKIKSVVDEGTEISLIIPLENED